MLFERMLPLLPAAMPSTTTHHKSGTEQLFGGSGRRFGDVLEIRIVIFLVPVSVADIVVLLVIFLDLLFQRIKVFLLCLLSFAMINSLVRIPSDLVKLKTEETEKTQNA